MEELLQGYNISAAEGSAASAKRSEFRLGRLDGRIPLLEISAEGLADQFGARPGFRSPHLLELPHHRGRQGNRHRLRSSHGFPESVIQ